MKAHLLIALVASPLLLSACGGGGDDDERSFTTSDVVDGRYDTARISGGLQKYRNITLKDKNNTDIILVDRPSNRFFGEHAVLPFGFHESKGQFSTVTNDGKQASEDVTIRSYRGHYASVLETTRPNTVFSEELSPKSINGFSSDLIAPTDFLPMNVIYTYKGKAFNSVPANDADLTYTIDYGNRRGSGEIAAASGHGKITLEEAPIRYYSDLIGVTSGYGVKDGVAKDATTGAYSLGIAGDNAEEIIGHAGYGQQPADNTINFVGSR